MPIRGTTPAAASVRTSRTSPAAAPSRAGTLPNTRGNLAGWIADPQNLKPGNHMPPTELASDDLQPLIAYLETLK